MGTFGGMFKMGLRPYQQRCFDASVDWMKRSLEPGLIEAATGAGKSHLVAAIAEWISDKSGGKVLCLAPSKELVEQNYEKFLATGNPASIYCASINKSLKHDVVFGSPLTVLNSIDKFCERFCGVIIDEAHGITDTIKQIILHLQKQRPKLRVIGLTATPYRLGSGYIYQYDTNGAPLPDTQTINPFFNTLIERIPARELIGQNYLTPPVAHDNEMASYDTSGLELNKLGQFDSHAVEQAFEGMGRKTAAIVGEIVSLSRDRLGVVIFAATVKHAKEVLDSLPPDNSEMISGKTKKGERERIIKAFKAQRIKYLVNVAVLTTGFDAPHVDVVAILRATESVGLLQQIIGRGLRLYEGKTDCLVLDYAENIERHCPDGDIFNPKIKAIPKPAGEYLVEAECPLCATKNSFSGRPNPDEFDIDGEGYFIDLLGERIKTIDDLEMPAHFGRRCFGQQIIGGIAERCDHRWSAKDCPECDTANDIAARVCESCGCELVDPNEKLKLEFQRIKRDPYSTSTDKVIGWSCAKHISMAGNDTLRIDYTTECRSFTFWYLPKKRSQWADLCGAVFGEGKVAPDVDTFLAYVKQGAMPQTVTVSRDKGSKFYTIYGHNRPADEVPN